MNNVVCLSRAIRVREIAHGIEKLDRKDLME